jgi:D-glycero-alpha-D-manno-heptose-7-phosphate kinase
LIISRTPFRITLGGGGTDLPSFYSENGGHVITMAIDKYIYITLKPNCFEPQLKLRYNITEIVNNASQLTHTRAKESLLLHKLNNNCEINSCADLPANSGMGSSGSYLVGLLNCIREYKRLSREPTILAEEACKIEINKLQEPVGKQDQYIAAFGGIKILNISTSGKVLVKNVNITQGDLISFLSNIHVYHLNFERSASEVLADQQKNKSNSNKLLKIVKEQSYEILNMLETSNFDSYGFILDKYWQVKKQLSTKISIPFVDEIYEYVKKEYGVLGGKIIGAGGGGFLMLYTPKNNKNLDKFMFEKNCKKLFFNIDRQGSSILGNFI